VVEYPESAFRHFMLWKGKQNGSCVFCDGLMIQWALFTDLLP
jgi:hypothetical protein